MRVRELRLTYAPVPGTADGRRRITNPAQAAYLVRPLIEEEAAEVFMLVLLDSKHHLIGVHTVSRGSLDSTLVHPREVFKAALLSNAAQIVTVHNHPSGDPTPSPDDRLLWERLNKAGQLLGVPCVDHMVIGREYYSLAEAGLL